MNRGGRVTTPMLMLGLLALLPHAADAQGAHAAAPAAPPAEDDSDDNEIVVQATRNAPQRGAVIGDIKPDQQLGPADIRSYGVSSVADLLAELAPETASVRGRGGEAPVVLLNGRRISGLAEIRDIPTEAIQRVDILPEEVALKYGFSADQRVVNFVLRRRFRSITAELDGGLATEGEGANGEAQGDLFRVRGDGRLQLDLKYQGAAALRESDRTIAESGLEPFDPSGTVGDIGRYRTLKPETRAFTANAIYARPIGSVSATVNASLDVADSDALRGLPTARLDIPADSPFATGGQATQLSRYLGTDPLTQDARTLTGHLGLTLNGSVAKWIWTFTGNFDHVDTRTATARGFDIAPAAALIAAGDPATDPYGSLAGTALVDHARSRADTGNAQLVASGPLFDLPAGAVSTTLKAGFGANGFHAASLRGGVRTVADLSREDGNGQVNIDVPITSAKNHVLGAIGDLSLNANAAIDHLSDFGTLTTLGYGFNWRPRGWITLLGSVTQDHSAPSVQQLGNPLLVTPGVRVFDALRGTTVDVTQIDGGNAALKGDSRRVFKLGLTLRPPLPGKQDLTLSANFVASRIRNAIASLPEPTAAIEAAFPDRFQRDADGDLTSIDTRAVNFARENRDQLRWGVNFSQPLKSRRNPALDAAMRQRFEAIRAAAAARGESLPERGGGDRGGDRGSGSGPGGASGGGRGPGGFRGGGQQNAGRIQIALYHTITFRDDVLIRAGLPRLDLLDGDSIGAGGGQPRQQLELQLGYSNNGVGARLSGQWQSGTTLSGAPGSPSGDLRFAPLATANLRLFANLAQIGSLGGKAWARGARITLSITNLADSRQRVRDATGATPLRYQPDYLDPFGRTIRISLRKLFF